MRNAKGFTLIEIIVAVALVAILSAAVAPSVLNNIAQGRVSRAQSDVQAIAGGVMRFRSEVARYPRLAVASHPDTVGEAFDFLASSNGTFPAIATGANWPTALTTGVVATASTEQILSHLIQGKDDAANLAADSYPKATNPDDPTDIGFRQGLISSDPADPWGHKYLINVAALGTIGQPVWVISAGANGVMETLIANTGTNAPEVVAGDDIGFRIQ